jgi:2-polyprenyl-3-methyl-5-hydroxy-6-metoxy-1,4-benzoquinol methylase
MRCPSCGGENSEILDRKYHVLSLARCSSCELLYRQPTTPPQQSREFYQDDYSQGYTTDMPDDRSLQEMLRSGFSGTERDYTRFVQMFDALGVPRGSSIMEFGCSWGYGAWQLAQAGYRVRAFEISGPRCRYAREKLGVDAHDSLESCRGCYDLVFSSHVLEHVDILSQSLDFLDSLVAPDGLMVHVTPNGSLAYRQVAPLFWRLLWGQVHPQLLDERYCLARYGQRPCLIAAPPPDPSVLKNWDRKSRTVLRMDGSELLLVVGADLRVQS